jgi:hypothetical protein
VAVLTISSTEFNLPGMRHLAVAILPSERRLI